MKKKWIVPGFNGLGIEFTKSAGPTATYLSMLAGGPGAGYKWRCDCCGAESDQFFITKELAEIHFNNNHRNSCPLWNYDVGACAIS